jgi:hypothetical protein
VNNAEIRSGERVVGEVVGHHRWGIDLLLDAPAPPVRGTVDVIHVTDERPFDPDRDYPPIGTKVEAVVLGYAPNGELRLSTRDSDVDPTRAP